MAEFLTSVESVYKVRELNYNIIFGNPYKTEVIFRQEHMSKQIDYFLPNSIFCFDYWNANKYGTLKWRVVIGRTIAVGEEGVQIPNVKPCVNLLFDVSGNLRAKAALKWVNLLKESEKNIDSLPNSVFEIASLRFRSMTNDGLKRYIFNKNISSK